jgi:hypothetical protein
VAGWIGDGPAWRSFEERWAEVLRRARPRIKEFKTAHCVGGHGAFRGWSIRRRRNLVNQLLEVIEQSDIHAVAATLAMNGPLRRRNADYLTCVNDCIGWLNYVASGYPRGERVAYILDERDKVLADVESIRRYFRNAVKGFRKYADRVGPLAFDRSDHFLPLQAADLLAHSVYRDVMAFENGAPPPPEMARLRPKCVRISASRWDARKRELRALTQGRWRRILPRLQRRSAT